MQTFDLSYEAILRDCQKGRYFDGFYAYLDNQSNKIQIAQQMQNVLKQIIPMKNERRFKEDVASELAKLYRKFNLDFSELQLEDRLWVYSYMRGEQDSLIYTLPAFEIKELFKFLLTYNRRIYSNIHLEDFLNKEELKMDFEVHPILCEYFLANKMAGENSVFPALILFKDELDELKISKNFNADKKEAFTSLLYEWLSRYLIIKEGQFFFECWKANMVLDADILMEHYYKNKGTQENILTFKETMKHLFKKQKHDINSFFNTPQNNFIEYCLQKLKTLEEKEKLEYSVKDNLKENHIKIL